jgi:hypothetical protein
MTSESYSYDSIRSGSDHVATTSVIITSGQNLEKYEPIGQVTATGKFIRSLPGANDGSQIPVYLTPFAIDATAGDKRVQVLKSGTFDTAQIVFDASYTDAQKLTAFVGTAISLQPAAVAL